MVTDQPVRGMVVTDQPSGEVRLVPPPPSNLAADGYSMIETQLPWRDNSHNEDGFEIEERIGSSVSPRRTVPADATWASSMYASSGTIACYRVRSFNKFGYSEYSNEACATAGHFSTPPPAPQLLKAKRVNRYQINLTWVTEIMLRYIEGFMVEMKYAGNQYVTVATIRVTHIKPSGEITLACDGDAFCDAISFNGVNSYPVSSSSGFHESATYRFRVRAFNNAGTSEYSNGVSTE